MNRNLNLENDSTGPQIIIFYWSVPFDSKNIIY